MSLAPIALFVYNRPSHTLKVLQSLQKNRLADQSTLYIFCDGIAEIAKPGDKENIQRVREIAASEKWCGEVHLILRETNWGLARSIVEGITQVVNEYGKIIVLEDDLVTSTGFLEYTNHALHYYAEAENVMHISAYMYPRLRIPFKTYKDQTFFIKFMSCWGWATWKRAWAFYNNSAEDLLEKLRTSHSIDRFNLDCSTKSPSAQLELNAAGKLNSWAIKWYASIFLKEGLCLFPRNSLVKNIGNDGTGTHPDKTNIYSYQKISHTIKIEPIPFEENKVARKQISDFFALLEKRKTLLDKAVEKLRLIR